MVRWATTAREIGFSAAKLEAIFSGPYARKGLSGPDEWIIEVVRAVRDAVGTDMTLMVEVQCAFDSVVRSLRTAEAIAPYDLFFPETPLWVDDLEGYAELRRRSPVRIVQGDLLSTRHELARLLERGWADVAQPDIGRVGGPTEAMRVVRMAAERDLLVVPHAWKTGISVAVEARLGAVTADMPFFGFCRRVSATRAYARNSCATSSSSRMASSAFRTGLASGSSSTATRRRTSAQRPARPPRQRWPEQ